MDLHSEASEICRAPVGNQIVRIIITRERRVSRVSGTDNALQRF